MASTSTDESGFSPNRQVDAASDLELLNRAKSVAELDQFLDFGPWWYAPLFATMIGGFTMFAQANSFISSAVMGAAALTAAGFSSIHDYRRRTVRTRTSQRSFWYAFLMVVTIFGITAAWGTATSWLGYERFFPGYAALGWVLTSLTFLGIRAALSVFRRQRAPLQ